MRGTASVPSSRYGSSTALKRLLCEPRGVGAVRLAPRGKEEDCLIPAVLAARCDTSTGPQSIVVTIEATDDLLGTRSFRANFTHPSSFNRSCNAGSAGELSGVFTCSIEFPQLGRTGTWTVESVRLTISS
jgi:hypothetical protein